MVARLLMGVGLFAVASLAAVTRPGLAAVDTTLRGGCEVCDWSDSQGAWDCHAPVAGTGHDACDSMGGLGCFGPQGGTCLPNDTFAMLDGSLEASSARAAAAGSAAAPTHANAVVRDCRGFIRQRSYAPAEIEALRHETSLLRL